MARKTAYIDLAVLWQSEEQHYYVDPANSEYSLALQEYLPQFYLQKQHQPFISKSMVVKKPALEGYYTNYCKRLELQKGQLRNFFYANEGFYDFYESCPIKREDVPPEDFERLFTLQLRHTDPSNPLALNFLLREHFIGSFKKNVKEFIPFLLSIVKKYQPFLFPPLPSYLQTWMKEMTLNPKFYSIITVKNIDSFVELSQQNESILPETFENLAIRIPFKPLTENVAPWTHTEIEHFFSFFHKDRGAGEGSFLEKQAVSTLLKNGIAIPTYPLESKFQLNTSKRFPKKIVDYFIYWFCRKYNESAKQQVLQFLGSYIEEYSKALDPKGIQIVSGNITGEKPKNRFFLINAYLPKRFQIADY